jgi:hypothetical protein
VRRALGYGFAVNKVDISEDRSSRIRTEGKLVGVNEVCEVKSVKGRWVVY